MMTSLKQNLSRTFGWLAVAAIRAYQVGLRPLNLWGCKFYPSCSHYALEAFEVHGPARGFWLTLKRLLRCRPGTFGGVDPVPAPEEFSQDKISAYPVAEATELNQKYLSSGSAHGLPPVGDTRTPTGRQTA